MHGFGGCGGGGEGLEGEECYLLMNGMLSVQWEGPDLLFSSSLFPRLLFPDSFFSHFAVKICIFVSLCHITIL